MSPVRARYIPELLEIHVEELEFLWGQRRNALHSDYYTLRGFTDLTERVEAHIQGLLAVPAALPDVLLPRLTGDGRDGVFAAACPLLRLADATITTRLLAELAKADGPVLAGLRDAFSFAPSGQFVMAMRQLLETGDSLHAAAAAVILSNQRLLDSASPRLQALLLDENPAVAEMAWLAAAETDARKPTGAASRPYQQALTQESPGLRKAVLSAAAWNGQAWLMPILCQFAAKQDWVGLECLAALGNAEDLPIVMNSVLGLEDRVLGCRLLARYGHPGVMETLAQWMANSDVALAAAAGEAFTLMTGCDIRGQRVSAPVAEEADEFEQAFADLVWLPDMNKARAYWQQQGKSLSTGTRWRQGIQLDVICTQQTLTEIDLQARWDAGARAILAGKQVITPPPIY